MHGTGHKGRLPPVVSSLFSIKAALKRCYQRHGAGSKGQGADRATAPRYPRKRLRLTRRGIEHEHEHEEEHEDEGPNVYNCVSLSERQAGALALQRDFRSSILSYSILHTPYSLLHHDQVMRRSS
jgi:hypothetical protein